MFTRTPQGHASLGGVDLAALLVEGRVSTPAYVYDLDAIDAEARALIGAFTGTESLVAYAVKANSAGPIVRKAARAGAGADVVSGAELLVATGAGVDPERILYSGVAKLPAELDRAIGAGERGILAIQIEAVEEIARIAARARALGRRARVSIRVNPGIEADTHANIATGHDEAKFGVAVADLGRALEELEARTELELVGIGAHVGSQLTDTGAYLASAAALVELARDPRISRVAPNAFLDFGGGFGVDYGTGCNVQPADFARGLVDLVRRSGLAARRIVVEPGRSLVAAHGLLCASVVGTKLTGARRWLLIDAGMNDLIRPALYGAKHRIEPVDRAPLASDLPWRVAGPVCESSDDFGEHPLGAEPPPYVVVRDAGAYGYTMASQYNGRPLPAEVFLEAGRIAAVRAARPVDEWAAERLAIDLPPTG